MSLAKISEKLNYVECAEDARVVEFCNIRERDLIRNQSSFIAEGKVVLQHLLKAGNDNSRFEIKRVLVLENRLSGISDLLSQLPETSQIFVAKREIMDKIAGFPIHRGVLALATYRETEQKNDWCNDISSGGLVLALSKISNHDNLGSIFRNAAAFGVDCVLLDDKCCHPLYRKSIRVSVGAALTVPFHFGLEIDDVLEQSAREGFSIYGLTPQRGLPLRELFPAKKNLLLLGSEGEGLSADLLSRVQNVRIEQVGDLDSLNVAMASGIALWHISTHLHQ